MKDTLARVGKRLVDLQYALSVVVALFLVFLIVIEVILRYVLKAPLMGIEELMLVPTIWLYMLGGADASYERSHIECGILTLYIKKERTVRIFELFKTTISLLLLLWLTRWGWHYLNYSLKLGKVSDLLYIPMVICEGAMFVGFALMSIYAVRDVVQAVRKFRAYCLCRKQAS